MPSFVAQLHLYKNIAGKKFPRGSLLFALYQLHDLFHWDQNLAEPILLAKRLDPLLERRFRFLLVAGKGVNDVPLFRHRGTFDHPIIA